MKANEHQVGGMHYKNASSIEHWDWVLSLGLGYLEGQATRYVCRWRKKDGLQDLQKALHYVNKIMENIDPERAEWEVDLDIVYHETESFAKANELTEQEADFCELIACWTVRAQLEQARDILLVLMDQAEGLPRPAPLEDSNKHAERA